MCAGMVVGCYHFKRSLWLPGADTPFCAVNHHIALLQNHTIGARHFGRHNLDFIQNLACLAAHTKFFLSATVVLKLTTLDRLWICDKHYIVNAQSIN